MTTPEFKTIEEADAKTAENEWVVAPCRGDCGELIEGEFSHKGWRCSRCAAKHELRKRDATIAVLRAQLDDFKDQFHWPRTQGLMQACAERFTELLAKETIGTDLLVAIKLSISAMLSASDLLNARRQVGDKATDLVRGEVGDALAMLRRAGFTAAPSSLQDEDDDH